MGGQEPVLARLQAAHLSYGAVQALEGVSLAVGAGEVVALLGPNGAGKTSALALLTGLCRPDAGRAELFGRDPRDVRARRRLGVMLQTAGVPDTLSVREHVRLFSSYYPAPRPVEESLRLADVLDLAQRRYGALSGGQQRRVQFALALCGRPDLLFVDEPTTGLDVEARRGFWAVLRGLVAEGAGVVLTTHYLEEADALADRVVVLHGGRCSPRARRPRSRPARVDGACAAPPRSTPPRWRPGRRSPAYAARARSPNCTAPNRNACCGACSARTPGCTTWRWRRWAWRPRSWR